MTQARVGDTVRIHYTGMLEDGTPFGSSAEGKPLELTIGDEVLMPALEGAIVGMEPGESKIVNVSAKEAFGEYSDDLVRTVNREELPDGMKPELGQRVEARTPDGRSARVIITKVSDTSITIDANHPLAGEDLTFEILLVDIV